MSSHNSIELELSPSRLAAHSVRPLDSEDGLTPTHGQAQALPPVDRGFRAWSFLAGAFIVETIVWGFPMAFGVFLAAYLQDPHFASQPHAQSILPLTGTLSSGIIYCSAPLIYPFIGRYPRVRRPMVILGAAVCGASLFAASYARTVEALLFLQGIAYAIGGAILYAPCISYMPEHFVARRGLANGILFAGTAVGGLVLPLILPVLINAWGIPVTLRVLSVAIVVALVPVLPFVKGRLPTAGARASAPKDTRWRRTPSFWALIAVNTLQGLSYFVPVLYISTFANSIEHDDTKSSLVVALLNGSSVVGRIAMGAFSDRFNPWLLALIMLSAASASVFIFWGILAHNLAGLILFGLTYGCIAGGWSSTWTGFLRPFAKDDPTLSTTLFGFLLLTRGMGNVLSTPIAAALYAGKTDAGLASHHTGFKVDGGRYESMIIYVGTGFAGAALLSAIGWGLDKRARA